MEMQPTAYVLCMEANGWAGAYGDGDAFYVVWRICKHWAVTEYLVFVVRRR